MSRFYATKVLGPRFCSFLTSGLLAIVTFVLVSLVFPQNSNAVDITFAWDANNEPGLDGYKLFYREQGDSYNYNHPTWVGSQTETTCTIYGLDDNTTYYFVARAFDEEGNDSGDSKELCYQPNAWSTETGSDSSGGCFIATAAYESRMAEEVEVLKNFRDKVLLKTSVGRSFVKFYYKTSPLIADYIGEHESLRTAVRIGLMPLVAISYSTIHFGPVITLTAFVLIPVIPILLVSFQRRKGRAVM